jgi:arylsulfatase A-like enzyme
MTTAGESSAAPPAAPGDERSTRLHGAVAALLGWIVVALVNTLGLIRTTLGPGGAGERALHHLFDFGHVLSLGLLAGGVVLLAGNFGPKRALLRGVLLAALSVPAAIWLLGEDLGGLAERLVGEGAVWSLRLLCAAIGLTVPLAWLTHLLPPTPWVRLPFVLAGAAVVAVNEHVLVNGYPDVHRWLALTGATLLAAAATGLPLKPSHVAMARRLTPRGARIALGVSAALAFASLAAPLPSGVELAMLERDTAFLAEPLADFHAPTERAGKLKIPRELRPWFTPRAGRNDVPPSSIRLLPPGGIVIVVTVDALRADALEPRYRKRLPTFTDMMKNGVTFSEARSFGSGTRVSLAALLTGRYQSMLRWTNPDSLRRTLERDELPKLPQLLAPHGVRTVAAAGLPRVFSPNLGIVTGFQESKLIDDGDAMKGTPEIVEHLLEQLKRQGPGSLFYYTHLLDPHYPYYRHRDGPKGSEASYRQEVEYLDRQLGRIRQGIRELGLNGRTLLVVSADHGEGFGEHGIRGHNKALYEVMVHVPLIVEGPGIAPRTVTTRVSMMDIGPTVLDVLGVPTPGYFMGESLVPLLAGGTAKTQRPIFMSGPNMEALLFQDGIKVILRSKPRLEEVYDLENDPKEQSNLRDTPRAAERIALARAYSAAHRWPNGVPPRALRSSASER